MDFEATVEGSHRAVALVDIWMAGGYVKMEPAWPVEKIQNSIGVSAGRRGHLAQSRLAVSYFKAVV